MAGPTISLNFEGNEKDLVDAFDNVGKAAEDMNESVGKTARDIKSHTKSFDSMAEGTDVAEKKFTGFKDVLDGGSSALATWNDESLSMTDKLIAFGQAGADMAGGLTDFLIPAISSVTTLMRGGLASAMNFIAAHPLIITITLLTAAIVLLWTQSETFRRVVIDAFNAVGGFVKNVFGGVIDWLIGAWNGVVNFFIGIPGRIGQAFATLGSIIGNVFKGAVNGVITAINWFVDHTLNWLIDRANDVIRFLPGVSYIPRIGHIPTLHTGGTVPGVPGTEVMVRAMAGEEVTSYAKSGNGDLNLYVSGDVDTFLYKIINLGLRTGKLKIRKGMVT